MEHEDDVLRRFKEKLEEKPGHPPAMFGMTRALIARDRPDEIIALAREQVAFHANAADMVLRMARKALPQHFSLTEALCNLPEDRGDLKELNMRWSLIRRKQPLVVEAHLGYIAAMLRQRRGDEAERATHLALRFVGQKIPLRIAQAEVAEARGRWAEAAGFWAAIARDTPESADAPERKDALERQHRAEKRAAETSESDEKTPSPTPITPEEHDEIRSLLMKFESIGANCEFGLLQRKFGAEPLGLLRFASTRKLTVKRLLATRFEGIGDPEAMWLNNRGYEYGLHHKHSDWMTHTRISPKNGVDPAKVLRDQCRHAAYLRRKLIEDLEEGNKIFVYLRPDLTDSDITELNEAVQSYGKNLLMCVRLSDFDHPAGSVEWRGERLMVASLDRLGNPFKGAGWDISDYWVDFCRTAQARWEELGSQTAQTIAA
jgi:hypothetical protein